MKPFTRSLDKLVENTKDHSTCRSAEQTAQDKETTTSSLQDKLAIQQEKAYHHASHTVEKRRKHQIPFIALALMMLFMSLCIISMAGLRPVALADKLTHLDATPTAPPDLSNVPVDQSVSDLVNQGNLVLGYGDKCEQFNSVVSNDKFCWNEGNFNWGGRDIKGSIEE
ncbi:MAG TPA: hypothetical protein VGL94_19165 [Ktedonobacteraceae bacterium]|jgi:hypothetical protein